MKFIKKMFIELRKRPCPYCGVSNYKTGPTSIHPVYEFELDEYHEEMLCFMCGRKWVRIYKPSNDVKEN